MPPDGRPGPDDIQPPRREVRHVAFPRASWTSFDRYERYGAITRALRATLGPGEHEVLDVGDSSGYLAAFDAGFRAVSVDIVPSAESLPGLVFAIGDGARLPFRDGAVDAVITSDSLEHVSSAHREAFVRELTRVAREVVVLGAPFDAPGVAGVEELVRRYCLLSSGQPQDQLDEHAEHGLPDLEATVAVFRDAGLNVEAKGNGNLFDWLLMMLLRQQLSARPALAPLEAGYDILYNFAMSGRSEQAPFYRQLVVAARTRAPAFGAPPEPLPGATPDIAALLGALIAADGSEASRQDTVPELHRIVQMQTEMTAQLSQLATRIEQLHQRVDNMVHPLRRIRGGGASREPQPDENV